MLLLAVAATLAFSFFGFLTSRLFAPVPLDMGWLLMAAPVGVMLDGVDFGDRCLSRVQGYLTVCLRQGDAAYGQRACTSWNDGRPA